MPVVINYVWLGARPLGALEKFNIYSWRALGHTVAIYVDTFVPFTPRTNYLSDLGLEEGDALVYDLRLTILGKDEVNVTQKNETQTPRALLSKTRAVLLKWLKAVSKDRPPGQDQLYNMIDLAKSYIGGTQRGIVLDLKVGPSQHVAAYDACFQTKFVSYTRGGTTAGLPENQCMGTMQESPNLRAEYAAAFDRGVSSNKLEEVDCTQKWFDLITGFHGRAFKTTQRNIDVATKPPDESLPLENFKVFEIGATSHGPFRVFKKASDQTNKAGSSTTKKDVRFLCEDVWRKELAKLKNNGGDTGFLEKVENALQELRGDSP